MRKFLCIFLLLCFAEVSFAQDTTSAKAEQVVQYDRFGDVTPVEFDEEKINNYKNDEEFDYIEIIQEDGGWQRFKRWLSLMWNRFWNWLLGDGEISSFWAVLIRLLPYLIVVGAIIFVGWLFYKLNPGSKLLRSKDTPEVFFTEEEEIIRTKDIRKLISKALENKDFRLAVRYYYLLILKRLTDAKFINYEFDKTNSDYMAETKGEAVYLDFAKATNLYDYIWYGNFEVTESDYQKAQHTFDHLEHQIPPAVE